MSLAPTELLVTTRDEAIALGMKSFFTGVPCKRGYIARRKVGCRTCYECDNQLQREKYASDPSCRIRPPKVFISDEDAKTIMKVCFRCRESKALSEFSRRKSRTPDGFRPRCKVCATADVKEWREKYPEKYTEVNRRSVAKWRDAHPEENKAASKAKYRNNIEREKAASRRRRAIRKGVSGEHTLEDIAILMISQKEKCAHAWCRKSIKKRRHIDHIMPLALGGTHDKSNIQILCPKCNLSKGAKHPVTFALQNGMLV